jgi:formamidopyrimidine-DNA glycosylase
MMELPEAVNMARQISETVRGKRIAGVTAAHTPHKLAWYYGEPATYSDLLMGRTLGTASPFGSMVELEAGDARVLFGEGVAARFHHRSNPRPARHQLLIEFDDGSAMSGSIRMYGGLGAFPEGGLENPYYRVAREKPSPLSAAFDNRYFDGIIREVGVQKISLKALLATNQRIPGLGNGVLQDILFNARLHPKRKVNTLSDRNEEALFRSIKAALSVMTEEGGRDTELDFFGRPGGYRTILSKRTAGRPCPSCGALLNKEAYMGGTVYYCPECQEL